VHCARAFDSGGLHFCQDGAGIAELLEVIVKLLANPTEESASLCKYAFV